MQLSLHITCKVADCKHSSRLAGAHVSCVLQQGDMRIKQTVMMS